ncbi:hypothetical protein [Parahaliea mediterranea]|uniref:Uncharacterized protein n=1 Tax=Parahaliea mediterranea TaxID=651086 RepID=A0A939DCD2_9GAMM|nr:hypothetical protein [Parahaliea mediterranea]MBN7795628.1 hypothetical protein [Parahaliea mediterranea]
MTSGPRALATPALLALLAAALLLAGCGPSEVAVKGQFPAPLMQKLPLTLGVWYDEEFSGHEFFDEAKGRAESGWIVRTGDAQLHMWNTLLPGMFQNVVSMRAKPQPGQMNQAVDAVLIPHIEELQYAIPAHTNVKVYEIWMRYRFELVSASGKPLAEWTMTAYGKTPTAFLQSDEAAVNLAAVVALRDAGANFATNFTRVPQVKDWLARRRDQVAENRS